MSKYVGVAVADPVFDSVTALNGIVSAGPVLMRSTPAAVSTVGNATYTAAQFVAPAIIRTGPTGAYSDTTPTAAQIIQALPGAVVGSGYYMTIVNTVAFAATIVAGTGVTLSGTTAIAASSARDYMVYVTALANPATGAGPTVTMQGVSAGTL